MPEQVSDVVEQLRRLSWEIRISRDSLLKASEGLPDSFSERSQRMAGRLTVIQGKVRETSATLPTDVDFEVPKKVSDNVAGLREEIEGTLRELDLLIESLHEVFKELPALKVN
jgi:hypothetical protein